MTRTYIAEQKETPEDGTTSDTEQVDNTDIEIIDLIAPPINDEDIVQHKHQPYGLGIVIRVGWDEDDADTDDESHNVSNDDDESDTDSDISTALLQNQIEVYWINDMTYSTELYTDIDMVDRSFLHSDICVKIDDKQCLGSILDVKLNCSIQLNNNTILHEIDSSLLQSTIDYVPQVCVVDKSNSTRYGMIIDTLCDLTIKLNTKKHDIIIAHNATPSNVQPLDVDVDTEELDEMPNSAYYIDQHVKLNRLYLREQCQTSDGRPFNTTGKAKYDGIITSIKPVLCDVEWLDAASRAHHDAQVHEISDDDHEDGEDEYEQVEPDQLIVFTPNQSVRWQLNDYCTLQHNGEPVSGKIVDIRSTVSVQWQNSTITHNIQSTELLAKNIVADTDFVPNDYVVNKQHATQVGYIVSVDTVQQMCTLVWLTDTYGTYQTTSPPPSQCSLFDLYAPSELEFTLYEYVLRHATDNTTHSNQPGAIIGYDNGLLKLQYADKNTELVRYCDVTLLDLDSDHIDTVQHTYTPAIQHHDDTNNVTTSVDKLSIDTNARHLSTDTSFKVVDTELTQHHFHNNTINITNKLKQRITTEWSQLQANTSTGIHIIAYEQRMDLLTLLIVGAEHTPYYNSLFVFDIQYPVDYPAVPPTVYYHANGYRISPNLYLDGKVCLSLLNTWHSTEIHHAWQPDISNVLQVILSLQGLILGSSTPYYLEHAHEQQIGNTNASIASRVYNESALIGSLNSLHRMLQTGNASISTTVQTHWQHSQTQQALQQLRTALNNVSDTNSVNVLHNFGIVLHENYQLSQGFVSSLQIVLNKLILH